MCVFMICFIMLGVACKIKRRESIRLSAVHMLGQRFAFCWLKIACLTKSYIAHVNYQYYLMCQIHHQSTQFIPPAFSVDREHLY